LFGKVALRVDIGANALLDWRTVVRTNRCFTSSSRSNEHRNTAATTFMETAFTE
jgi:hypothetical protein